MSKEHDTTRRSVYEDVQTPFNDTLPPSHEASVVMRPTVSSRLGSPVRLSPGIEIRMV